MENITSNKFDYSLSLIRIVSTFFIVICHLHFLYDNVIFNLFGNFFDVGVPIFLILSGWLYSNKEIGNSRKWIINRYIKLCFPCLIWESVTVIIIAIIEGNEILLKDCIIMLLNIQGLDRFIGIINDIELLNIGINYAGHLWFITIIMICYCMVVLSKCLERKISFSKKNFTFVLLILLIIMVPLAYVKVYLFYFICFFVGYYLKRFYESISLKQYIFLSLMMIMGVISRLLGHRFFDNTILYVDIIAKFTHLILGLWIFYSLRIIYEYWSFVRKYMSCGVILHLDKISYYIYITHFFFLVSPFRMSYICENKLIQFIAFCAFTIISAELLMIIDKLVSRRLFRVSK